MATGSNSVILLKRVYNLAAREARVPRVVLASCKLSVFLTMNTCLVSANDVMEHFLFPGNIDCAADDQGALSCCIHKGLMYFFIVCETMLTLYCRVLPIYV